MKAFPTLAARIPSHSLSWGKLSFAYELFAEIN